MYTYIELKEQEKKIFEQIEEIRGKNFEAIKELIELSKTYQEEFRILPKELKTTSFYKMHSRLEVLKEEIEISTIDEEAKNTIIKLIDLVDEKITENNIKLKECDEQLLENTIQIEHRRAYIEEKIKLIESNYDKIAKLDKKKELHQQIIDNGDIDERVKEEAKKVIANIEIEKALLIKENNEILKEENLKEDIIELNKEEQLEEPKKEEKKKEEVTTIAVADVSEENTPEVSIEERIEEAFETPELSEEITEEQPELMPVTPEEPQEVVNVHRASPELIGKIKKAGKVGLGILVIGAAVAAIIANPMALFAIPAGGLLLDQAKEKLLKK